MRSWRACGSGSYTLGVQRSGGTRGLASMLPASRRQNDSGRARRRGTEADAAIGSFGVLPPSPRAIFNGCPRARRHPRGARNGAVVMRVPCSKLWRSSRGARPPRAPRARRGGGRRCVDGRAHAHAAHRWSERVMSGLERDRARQVRRGRARAYAQLDRHQRDEPHLEKPWPRRSVGCIRRGTRASSPRTSTSSASRPAGAVASRSRRTAGHIARSVHPRTRTASQQRRCARASRAGANARSRCPQPSRGVHRRPGGDRGGKARAGPARASRCARELAPART